MIDTWFKQDIERIFKANKVAVIIDTAKEANFLLNTLAAMSYSIVEINTDIEELQAKYSIEKETDTTKKFLLYTLRPKEKLKFIREYCETNGVVEIKYLSNYIKEKLHKNLNINIDLPDSELIPAAKISMGKDTDYWTDLCNKGSRQMFEMEKELLAFVHQPEEYTNHLADDVRKIFYQKVNALLKQDYIEKPAETLAKEVVTKIFDSLVSNSLTKPFNEIYFHWLDSKTYHTSFDNYLKNYKLPAGIDTSVVHSSHPFIEIDKKLLIEIGKEMENKAALKKYLPQISKRASDKVAQLRGITFWNDVLILLNFDEQKLNQINKLKKAIEFYTAHFYTLDTAIRHLYTYFLNEPEILLPYQQYYNKLVNGFLFRWFRYFDEYQQNQSGIIKRIIEENNCKTAIIVGDGITYELAKSLSCKISVQYKVTENHLLSDYPSETENNMSRMFVSTGEIMKVHQQRKDFLTNELNTSDIGFVNLDDINEATDKHKYLICTVKDIDSLGEKMQLKALKYISESETTIAKKTEQLLLNGYRKVFLISDHGFVLTGILTEADKVEINFEGEVKKNERFIRSVQKQPIEKRALIERQQKYENYSYLYFSTVLSPFKTTGAYGFCHGGISPQELITPFFCIENQTPTDQLEIEIANKADLTNITGELFCITLKSAVASGNLFKTERKICMLFFDDGKQISQSEILSIQANTKIEREYSFDGHNSIDIKLLDANSKEQIDSATVTKNNSRDLGGLL